MSGWISNVFRLGLKELSSLSRDVVMMVLICYTFTVAIYTVATGIRTEVTNAAVAVVDGDDSELSQRLRDALQEPYFKRPLRIDRSTVDQTMDDGEITFVLDLPPHLEADLLAGRKPVIQLLVDATAMTQAGVGTTYIQNIVAAETLDFLQSRGATDRLPAQIIPRIYFNPNLESFWFNSVMQILENITILSMILVGAAVIRERERGTIEHLLVMPVTASEIALAKIWANGLVVLIAAGLSLLFVVEGILGVPIAGSIPLFLTGTAIYLFASTALGVMLATIANTMPQFGLLSIPVFVVMNLLSGAATPQEAMPDWLRLAMQVSPSTHFVRLAQSVLYRGAGPEIVWPQMAVMIGLGSLFLIIALARFRTMLARQG